MSLDFNWKLLDQALAENLTHFLNHQLQANSIPYLQSIQLSDLNWGTEPPEITLIDIRSPFPQFYLQDDPLLRLDDAGVFNPAMNTGSENSWIRNPSKLSATDPCEDSISCGSSTSTPSLGPRFLSTLNDGQTGVVSFESNLNIPGIDSLNSGLSPGSGVSDRTAMFESSRPGTPKRALLPRTPWDTQIHVHVVYKGNLSMTIHADVGTTIPGGKDGSVCLPVQLQLKQFHVDAILVAACLNEDRLSWCFWNAADSLGRTK
jgi:hypothetical protein